MFAVIFTLKKTGTYLGRYTFQGMVENQRKIGDEDMNQSKRKKYGREIEERARGR
jgi:hypothetical protein